MASDKEVGEFLLRELFQLHAENVAKFWLFERWDWAGRIIEAMRERDFHLVGHDGPDNAIWFFNGRAESSAVLDKLSPSTIALCAAKALGMEVDDGK